MKKNIILTYFNFFCFIILTFSSLSCTKASHNVQYLEFKVFQVHSDQTKEDITNGSISIESNEILTLEVCYFMSDGSCSQTLETRNHYTIYISRNSNPINWGNYFEIYSNWNNRSITEYDPTNLYTHVAYSPPNNGITEQMLDTWKDNRVFVKPKNAGFQSFQLTFHHHWEQDDRTVNLTIR